MPHSLRCRAQHFGPWAIELGWLREAVAAIHGGMWRPRAAGPLAAAETEDFELRSDRDGIAIIELSSQLQKGWSKYGGTSTVAVRRVLREVANSADVRGVLLVVDSPGGTVAGTAELAADVRRVAARKPVHVHIEDLAASAAYWIASQADHITANEVAQIGSIGAYAVVEDSSKRAEDLGITVHVLRSGARKGLGVPGEPVPAALLEELQGIVDTVQGFFVETVAAGRGLAVADVEAIADGRLLWAKAALGAGLIDAIGSIDAAVGALRSRTRRTERLAGAAAEARKIRATILSRQLGELQSALERPGSPIA